MNVVQWRQLKKGTAEAGKVRGMKITKIDGNGKEYNYGHCENINEVIPKSYHFNGLFYERENTKTIYIVEND